MTATCRTISFKTSTGLLFWKYLPILFFIFCFSHTSFAQSPCDLGNFTSAYILNANDYPYTSVGSGITVDYVLVGGGTINNFNYDCNGQTFSTASPAFWLNGPAPSQSLTYNFSVPVTSFSVVVNGTNLGEEFYFAAATGSVQVTNFCTANFASINGGTGLICNNAPNATGTLITVENPVGSTSYTLTHNGVGAGSRYALLDCIVGIQPGFTASNFCAGDTTIFSLTQPFLGDSLIWNFDDPGSGLANTSTDTMPTHIYANAGSYDVTLITYDSGLSDTFTNTIVINPLPNVVATNTGPYCVGDPISLSETGGDAVSWSWTSSGSAGIVTATSQSPNVYNGSNGETFTVTVEDANGCIDTAQTTIVINPLPIVSATNNGPICAGDTLIVSETGGAATSWTWTSNGFSTIANPSNQSSEVVGAMNTETFIVTVMDANGCSDTAHTIVTVNPLPLVNAENSGPYCAGDPITLNESGGEATSWSWTSNGSAVITTSTSQSPVITNAVNGEIFTVVVQNSIGCVNSDQTTLVINSLPEMNATNSGPYCEGDTVSVNETGGDAVSWQWSTNGSSAIGNSSAQSTEIYGAINGEILIVTGMDANGCENSDTTILSITPLPIVNLGEDAELCYGNVLVLNASTSNGTYEWQDGSTNASFSVTDAGNYWVIVTVNNCSSYDEINVEIVDCEAIVEMPNVFTPNNDGANDLFIPVINKGVASMHTMIFNRWGNLVYETNDPNIEWNGGDLNEGTYFWLLKITDLKGQETKKHGFVNLVRN